MTLSPLSAWPRRTLWAAGLAGLLSACGGGGLSPDDVENPAGSGGQKLSFAYFQRCIQPILVAQITAPDGGGTNSCASGGCHADSTGTGGALRLVDGAVVMDLAAGTDVLRASAMYTNYYSALRTTLPGSADDSRLFNKPLVRGMLHGGGQIFTSPSDPLALLIRYWIEHPAPATQDEFSHATDSMFTPADPVNGSCNTATP